MCPSRAHAVQRERARRGAARCGARNPGTGPSPRERRRPTCSRLTHCCGTSSIAPLSNSILHRCTPSLHYRCHYPGVLMASVGRSVGPPPPPPCTLVTQNCVRARMRNGERDESSLCLAGRSLLQGCGARGATLITHNEIPEITLAKEAGKDTALSSSSQVRHALIQLHLKIK